jgi:4-amino-4-deoxy-L-arabinose transferase and related glycosyltransferases of PMT family
MPAFLSWMVFIFFIYKFSKRIYKNEHTAWLGVLIATFVPLVFTGSHIMTHDIPMIFFASFAWYFLYLAIEEGQKKAWYWVGLFFGLALLSKFQAVLIALAALIMIILRPSKRKILLTKEPYIACLMGLIMFIPVLYWNWSHHWAAFLWQSQHGIHQTIRLKHELEFISGQMGVFSPFLFILLGYYTIKRLIHWKTISSESTFLIFCFLPVFCFFGVTSLTKAAEANWPAVGFFPAILFLSGELGKSLPSLSVFKRRLLQIYLGFAILISILLLSFVRYPELFITKLHLEIKPGAIMTNSIYGWDRLGQKVDQIIDEKIQSKNQPVPIFGDSYQTAAELQYYVSKPVAVFTTRQAHRCHFDFITAQRISSFDKQAGLVVSVNKLPANSDRYFQGIKWVDTLTITRFHSPIRTFFIYQFQALNAPQLYKMAVDKPYGYPGTYPD